MFHGRCFQEPRLFPRTRVGLMFPRTGVDIMANKHTSICVVKKGSFVTEVQAGFLIRRGNSPDYGLGLVGNDERFATCTLYSPSL